MIDIHAEELDLLTRALNRWVPGRPHASTGWRWATRGIGGHKLETIKSGGRTYTSRQAVERFLSALNGGRKVATSIPPDQREREINAAEARFAAAGIR